MRKYINNNWYFNDTFEKNMLSNDYEYEKNEEVRIPHTVKETPLHYFDEHEYQKEAAYFKDIFIPEEWMGKDIYLTFEGVLHSCTVYVNGNAVTVNQIAYTLAREATFENRLLCLGLISNHFDLKWYTYEESQVIGKINKVPPVDYYTEMPTVFYSSKINLHIGLYSIPYGISQRQLDIMSCGGFLLSSYQPELFDYFIPGEDFDYFTCAEDALDKCRFYIKNEEIRRKIAVSGRIKTNEMFDYEKRVKELMSISFGEYLY